MPLQKSTNGRTKSFRPLARSLAWTHRIAPVVAERWAARLFFTPRRPGSADRGAFAGARALQIGGLAAWRWGDGPPVLLVHGWEGDAGHLAAFVEPLRARGLDVVAFDAPAHGRSPGHSATLPEYADAVARVAAGVGPIQGVIGHSFGALATLLALRTGMLAAPSAVLIAPPSPLRQLAWFASALELPPELAARVQRRIHAVTGWRLADVEPATLASTVRTPGLVLHDRDDSVVPWQRSEALSRAWRGSELHLTAGLGHRRILADPDVLRTSVAFLAAHRRETRESPDLARSLDLSRFVVPEFRLA